MRGHRVRFAFLMTVCLLLEGCAPAPAPEANGRYAVDSGLLRFTLIAPYYENEFWKQVYAGIEQATSELGRVDIVVTHPSRANTESFLRCYEAAVAARVDGILSICFNEDMQRSAYAITQEAGIPLVLLGSDSLSEELRDGYCGIDNYSAGRMAGKIASDLCADSARIGVLSTTLDSLTVKNRLQGLEESLKDMGDTSVVAMASTDSDRFKAASKTSAILSEHPEINCLFCTDGLSAVGAAYALESAGLSDRVALITFDDDEPIPTLLEKGVVDAYLRLPSAQIGYEGVRMLYELCKTGFGKTRRVKYLECEAFPPPGNRLGEAP